MKQFVFTDDDFDLVDPIMEALSKASDGADGLEGEQISLMVAGMFMHFGRITDERMTEILWDAVCIRRGLINKTLNDNEHHVG